MLLALSSLSMLPYGQPFIVLGWMISAIYLKLLPRSLWIKTRLMLDLSTLPQIYNGALRIYNLGATGNLVIDMVSNDPLLPLNKIILYFVVSPFIIKYTAIYFFSKTLTHVGFFRRLVV